MGVFLNLWRLGEDNVTPRLLALLGNQLARPYLQRLGSHLHVGKFRSAQVPEPVRVAWGAGGGTPDKETVGDIIKTLARLL